MSKFIRSSFIAILFVVCAFVQTSITAHAESTPLVNTSFVKENLTNSDVLILDVRGQFAKVTKKEFEKAHIPGSVWAPYQGKWRAKRGDVVGVLPPLENTIKYIGSLGISNDKTVVIVHAGANALEFGAATRIYWTLKYLGHDKVSILNGGFAAWTKDASNPVETGEAKPVEATFEANVRKELLVTTEQVSKNLKDGPVLLDARPIDQFKGLKKHPKAVRFGRLPNALHLDQAVFYDAKTNMLRDLKEISSLVPNNIKSKDTKIVSYCNTAHWAATNWFVLSELLGYKNVQLYDDSMVGWTRVKALPMDSDRTRLDDIKDYLNSFFK